MIVMMPEDDCSDTDGDMVFLMTSLSPKKMHIIEGEKLFISLQFYCIFAGEYVPD
jgi:hypothetical protein